MRPAGSARTSTPAGEPRGGAGRSPDLLAGVPDGRDYTRQPWFKAFATRSSPSRQPGSGVLPRPGRPLRLRRSAYRALRGVLDPRRPGRGRHRVQLPRREPRVEARIRAVGPVGDEEDQAADQRAPRRAHGRGAPPDARIGCGWRPRSPRGGGVLQRLRVERPSARTAPRIAARSAARRRSGARLSLRRGFVLPVPRPPLRDPHDDPVAASSTGCSLRAFRRRPEG